MSSSRLGQAEQSVAPAIERAAAIEAAAAPPAQTTQPAQPATPGATRVVGIPEGAPKVDARGFTEATFDDVKFEMVKTDKFERSMLTPKVQSLFDKRIRIRGYMYPTMRRKGLTQFVLVRDNMECCFGPGAALYDCILITMEPGKTAEYSIRPIAVEGTFRLDEYPGPDGRPLAIYQMRGEAVQ
ncbi:MAG: DUF3299 domain-containing protein [Pirellulales bacterium]|nr:DUF3299 domain-containing protein [Pirellulales bacterium]